MALKTVLDTTDGLDEAIAALYTEQDGKFILQIEGVDDHPEVVSLKNAYARTKADREQAKGEAATLKAQIKELQESAPDTAATQAKLNALEEKLAAAEAKASEVQQKYIGVTRDKALTSSLLAAGIKDETYLEAATLMVKDKVKVSDDGSVYVETDMGPKMLDDFVKSFVAGKGAKFVAPAIGMGAKESDRGGATVNNKPLAQWTPAEKGAYIRENGLDKWKTLIAS